MSRCFALWGPGLEGLGVRGRDGKGGTVIRNLGPGPSASVGGEENHTPGEGEREDWSGILTNSSPDPREAAMRGGGVTSLPAPTPLTWNTCLEYLGPHYKLADSLALLREWELGEAKESQ